MDTDPRIRRRDLTREIATTRDGRDITRGYVDRLPWVPPRDQVWRIAGGWRGYDELLRDDQVAACLAQRRLAVVSRDWEVVPGGETRIDRRAADLLRETLENIEWDRVTDQMLHAVFYGLSIAELIWQTGADGIRLADIRVRDRARFAFRADGTLLLRTLTHPDGEEMPPGKFWIVRHGGSHHDALYGQGLASALYWPVWFKRHGARYWSVFLEKFGSPTAVGKFDPQTTGEEARRRLLEAVEAIQTDAGIIIPHDMEVTLLEATRGGRATYEQYMAYWDRAIAKVILGQTMTTEDGSSRAQAQVHYEVRRDIVQADADLISGAANRTWVRWLIDLVLPGAAYPQLWRDLADPEDLNRRAERDRMLHQMGWRLTADAVTRIYGEGYEPAAAAVATPSPGTGAPPTPAAVAAAERENRAPAGEDVTPIAPLSAALAEQTVPALDELFAPIRAMVGQARDLKELRDRLRRAYDALSEESLADILAMAMATAELIGRYDLIQESGDAGPDGGA